MENRPAWQVWDEGRAERGRRLPPQRAAGRRTRSSCCAGQPLRRPANSRLAACCRAARSVGALHAQGASQPGGRRCRAPGGGQRGCSPAGVAQTRFKAGAASCWRRPRAPGCRRLVPGAPAAEAAIQAGARTLGAAAPECRAHAAAWPHSSGSSHTRAEAGRTLDLVDRRRPRFAAPAPLAPGQCPLYHATPLRRSGAGQPHTRRRALRWGGGRSPPARARARALRPPASRSCSPIVGVLRARQAIFHAQASGQQPRFGPQRRPAPCAALAGAWA